MMIMLKHFFSIFSDIKIVCCGYLLELSLMSTHIIGFWVRYQIAIFYHFLSFL